MAPSQMRRLIYDAFVMKTTHMQVNLPPNDIWRGPSRAIAQLQDWITSVHCLPTDHQVGIECF
ncbi:hypothetical protein M404DRAFT_915707 [Pisolithus tinctorius Marx 270]|uniref:Uncharacterized protein n=1 Tax=Pisolithus tinctorius Marx 270 TaxID=870435 RepID=A0A0C3JHS6_PISTI|nr:hypothetical protein M404DRAFT_915707 [Pisolithus tinctorius Marx 270]